MDGLRWLGLDWDEGPGLEELRQRVKEPDKLTTMDKLFAAYALMDDGPEVTMPLIEGVLEDRDSPLARMLVALLLAVNSYELDDIELLEEAIHHMEVAVAFGADAPGFVVGQFTETLAGTSLHPVQNKDA